MAGHCCSLQVHNTLSFNILLQHDPILLPETFSVILNKHCPIFWGTSTQFTELFKKVFNVFDIKKEKKFNLLKRSLLELFFYFNVGRHVMPALRLIALKK